MVGKTISHYRILSELGRGGMGIVYKAEDTKLERTVALKFLAPHAIEDPEHKARFVREAKAAARLNHQNICPVYEIDEADGQTFLAMAFLEGQTVKAKIAQRPLKLEEALDVAVQTAQGLKAAHQNEVVHRDIKPANLMLTGEGQVKVMDFGLAQLAEASKLTKTQTMLGTPAYMSPEQARREPTDRRTDVWSLGVVIYEMVTGRLPFEGERQEAVLYAIANEEPEPITALRAGLPMDLEWIVGKALAKDPTERYQHVEEMIVDLKSLSKKLALGKSTILQSGVTATPPGIGVQQALRSAEEATKKLERLKVVSVALAVVLLVVAVGISVGLWLRAPESTPELPLRRFAFAPVDSFQEPVISPAGRHITYVAGLPGEFTLWVQDLDRDEPRQIVGPGGNGSPFWSPDSNFIAFRASRELKKVSVQGGPTTTLCELPSPTVRTGIMGGAWSPDGNTIVFSAGYPLRLYQVPSQGGTPKLLFEPEESEQRQLFVSPHFLPKQAGSRGLLFVISEQQEERLVLQNLDSGRREVLAPGNQPFYSPTGHIVYQTAAGLWALPFSAETLTTTGEPFPIKENASYPSVAGDGTLLYHEAEQTGLRQLVWRDRGGKKLGVIGRPQQDIRMPVLSPEGSRVVVRAFENENWNIWIHDVARPLKTRVSFAPANVDLPTWTAKGDKITFSSNRNGNWDIFVKSADGSGEAEPLLATPFNFYGYEWSSDGKYLVGPSGRNIWYLQAKEGASGYEKVMFFDNPSFHERGPDLSPDARFLAYESDESGRFEVYVQPFPQGGGKRQLSTNGGHQPRWRGDGKELFYVEGDTLVAVSVTTRPTFSVGSAKRLFDAQGALEGNRHRYDVSPDGQRFVMVETLEEPPAPLIRVVQNWLAEFRGRG